jgi:hypothetical protein
MRYLYDILLEDLVEIEKDLSKDDQVNFFLVKITLLNINLIFSIGVPFIFAL